MQKKKRSPLAAIVLAVVIGLLVIALLNGVIRPTQVVVAKIAIAQGTVLSDNLLELRTIPMGGKPAGAFSKIAAVSGKILAVGRAPGDFIVSSVLGEAAEAGIPGELSAGSVALAIHVDQASGVAGLLRPGQSVTVIGMLSPDRIGTEPLAVDLVSAQEFAVPLLAVPSVQGGTPAPTPTIAPPIAPLARLVISGVRVLMVPQPFRYEEVASGASEEELFSSARTSLSAQEGSVIVLEVPTQRIEITPGYWVNPAALLSALDQYGILSLALEPSSGLATTLEDGITLNLGELYQQMNVSQGAGQ